MVTRPRRTSETPAGACVRLQSGLFSTSTNYFDPSQPFMINYIVDDLRTLEDEGITVD